MVNEIEHGTVSTTEEDSVKLASSSDEPVQPASVLPQRLLGLVKPDRVLIHEVVDRSMIKGAFSLSGEATTISAAGVSLLPVLSLPNRA